MNESILITQCLQNDFVKLIDRYESLPNLLHVGFDEAKRLLGEKIEEGPLNTVMDWAYSTKEEILKIIHIRDWHDEKDAEQKDHLEQFGVHCVKDSEGARFVFEKYRKSRKDEIVNASGLNDFWNTNLEQVLSPYKNEKIRVGVIGVWTEAKVNFLLYELKTRYPNMELATCSALCASSSRASHFIALDQLKSILGIKIYSSIADFTNFLNGTIPEIHKRVLDKKSIELVFKNEFDLSSVDEEILYYLFRDARIVELECLDGGYSGNVVLRAKAFDKLGHAQVPAVVKIGKREPISKERISFEKISEVLGNNAPSIIDYAELGERGAIKYRYAAMQDSKVRTFQKYYSEETDLEKIKEKLDIIYKEQLGRLYQASSFEKLDLLQYYEFTDKYKDSVRKKVEQLIITVAQGEIISLHGVNIPNVCNFYDTKLKTFSEKSSNHYTSYLHGDLNGANIIIDKGENVWIIDFFHTHKGHILKDLFKMENDLLYIFMKIGSVEEFLEATKLIDLALNISELGDEEEFDKTIKFQFHEINKAYQILIHLRNFYKNLIGLDKDPYQLYVGLMRYSMHTLSFDEPNDWQKKLALYAGAICSEKITKILESSNELRLDELKMELPAKIFMTILMGRKDRNRDLQKDLQTLKKNSVDSVLTLITTDEMEFYGVPNLISEIKNSGIENYHLSILDQKVPDFESLEKTLTWIEDSQSKKKNLLVHCVGGLGRTGTILACFLVRNYQFNAENAIKLIRDSRSPRAIETIEQENFIKEYETRLKNGSNS